MSVGVYLCSCGGAVGASLPTDALATAVLALPEVAYVEQLEIACGGADLAAMRASLAARRPDRVVVAACSVREHEATFQQALEDAGMNPFLVHLVNVREQVAWVTPDPARAVEKATAQIRAGVARVREQRPLERRTFPVETGVIVIGAGAAGLTAARTLADAGRDVTVVERSAVIGGVVARLDAIFPSLECGSCLTQPLLTDVLHGSASQRIRLLTLTDVVARKGSFGNFTVTLRRRARHVDPVGCIGCQECLPPCPVVVPDGEGGDRRAIHFVEPGALPNAPVIDPAACVRASGEACTRCADACPVPSVFDLARRDELVDVRCGAIVVAVGAVEDDLGEPRRLGHGRVPSVVTGAAIEHALAIGGPGRPALRGADGMPPRTIALVHCGGTLDEEPRSHCSPGCCQASLKWSLRLATQLPDAVVHHVYRTMSPPDRASARLLREVRATGRSRFLPCVEAEGVSVSAGPGGRPRVEGHGRDGAIAIDCDLVAVCAPLVGPPGAAALAAALGLAVDASGFFDEGSALAPLETRARGVFLAGSCRGPGDARAAVTAGAAAAGLALAALRPGRELPIEPAVAAVDPGRCSGCRACLGVCPYRAIEVGPGQRVAVVNPTICLGCGACVAACPAAAVVGHHFTDAQLFAEIEGALA